MRVYRPEASAERADSETAIDAGAAALPVVPGGVDQRHEGQEQEGHDEGAGAMLGLCHPPNPSWLSGALASLGVPANSYPDEGRY